MKRSSIYLILTTLIFTIGYVSQDFAALREVDDYESLPKSDPERDELMDAQEALEEMDAYMSRKARATRKVRKPKREILIGDEGFIAGPEWEFDGFVVGGRGQDIRSMFVVNDLIYLNVGLSQGFESGDLLGIYKRGARIRDPNSGRFIGFEIEKVGVGEITNRIQDETCTMYVKSANDGIVIGDLVLREN